jgi:N6-adenosine-specific RNA methylase IME4
MTYSTIVIDPPWDHSDGTGYAVTSGFGRTREQRIGGGETTVPPYSSMSLPEIAAIGIESIAAPDAHLYLWTTNRYLRHIWGVAEAWGFSGVCVIVWCKPPTGVMPGGAWGSNVEFCLFARRGSLPSTGKAPGRWYEWPRRRGASVQKGQRRSGGHSAKPEAFLDLVEQVSPGPYLEVFARRARFGWEYAGDGSHGTVEIPGLRAPGEVAA